jgi:hypothetical protein
MNAEKEEIEQLKTLRKSAKSAGEKNFAPLRAKF